MFYSHSSQPLEFILFAVLSTHFLLHQYFISSFPLFYLLFTSFLLSLSVLFFLSCLCTVADIYNPSNPNRFSPKNFFTFSILSSLFSFPSFIWSLSCFTQAPLLSRPRGPVRCWTEAVCCRWSWTLSFALVKSHGAAFRHTQRSRGVHRRL